ncbi:MAG: DNRLRE domain-containing protein [Bryobacteraceae bacterium]
MTKQFYVRMFRPLAAAVLLSSSAWAIQVQLIGDSWVSANQPTLNFGTQQTMTIGATGGPAGLSNVFVQFDLSTVPEGAQINAAHLVLYVDMFQKAGTIQSYALAAPWNEATITFNNAPALLGPSGSAQVTATDQTVSLDVTSLVQSWISGQAANYGSRSKPLPPRFPWTARKAPKPAIRRCWR